MKKPLVIFSFLSLLFSSFFSQPEPGAVIQPLMDCLTEALPVEKSKPTPTIQGVKDACVFAMARKTRMYLGGVPAHIVQRGKVGSGKVGSDESFYNQKEVERDCCFS